MNLNEEYAKKWITSSKYFYDNGIYSWMCSIIKDYENVLELGCGTGYSTLSLLENNHKVTAIDNNGFCIQKAKELLCSKGYLSDNQKSDKVEFLKMDFVEENIIENLKNQEYDIVINWNVGIAHDSKTFKKYYSSMRSYGLTHQQINVDEVSSYSETVQFNTCKIAHELNASSNLVDRGQYITNSTNDEYYIGFKNEFNFDDIKYINIKTKSISGTGQPLRVNGSIVSNHVIDIIMTSILYY